MGHDQLHAAGLENHQDARHQQYLGTDVRAHGCGFCLWLAFGLLKTEWPIIIPNGVCLFLSAFILLMKLLPRAKKDAVADAIDPTGRASDTNSGSYRRHRPSEG